MSVVSVLVPTYNQDSRLLKDCLDSVLSQSFRDLELIVSDNHSTNGASELLREYDDPRIRVVKPQSFVPMNENFAFCADHARSEYISFLSSDDLLLPGAIEALHAELSAHPECAFAAGNIYRAPTAKNALAESKEGLIRPYSEVVQVLDAESARRLLFPWQMSSTWMAGDMIRSVAYTKTGGLRNCRLYSAGDVWLTEELLKHGGFLLIGRPLALFRSRGVTSKEADCDRRINDLLDEVILGERDGRSRRKWNRLFQCLKVIYRVAATPKPTDSAIERSMVEFRMANREDLVATIQWIERRTKLSSFLSGGFRFVDIVRRTIWQRRL